MSTLIKTLTAPLRALASLLEDFFAITIGPAANEWDVHFWMAQAARRQQQSSDYSSAEVWEYEEDYSDDYDYLDEEDDHWGL